MMELEVTLCFGADTPLCTQEQYMCFLNVTFACVVQLQGL